MSLTLYPMTRLTARERERLRRWLAEATERSACWCRWVTYHDGAFTVRAPSERERSAEVLAQIVVLLAGQVIGRRLEYLLPYELGGPYSLEICWN